MRLVACTREPHADAILRIFNDAIAHTTALYDYRPRTPAMIVDWFAAKAGSGFPIIGVEADDGTLMGFASYGPFRPNPAYLYTAEHSLYVDENCRRRGVGAHLMAALVESARRQDFHVLVGGIDSSNAASIALHRRFGFEHAGTIRHAGRKFGRWLDLDFYQLILPTPAVPLEAGP